MGFKTYLLKILKKSDFFGYPVTLNFEHRTRFRSALGGMISLSTVIMVILLTYSGGASLLQRENSQVSQSSSIHQYSPSETLNTSHFSFFIRTSFEGYESLNRKKKVFNITTYQVTLINGKELYQYLPMQVCDKKMFKNMNGQDFTIQYNHLQLENYLCPTNNQQMILSGPKFTNGSSFLKIQLSECTDPIKCYTQAEIAKIQRQRGFPYLKIIIGFTNIQLDSQTSILTPNLQDTTFITYFKNQLTRVDAQVQKTTFIEDLSILPTGENLKTQVLYNVPYKNIRSQMITQTGKNSYCEIYLTMDEERMMIKKTYDRLDTYLAYVGGIIQTFIFLLTFIVGSYNRFGFYAALANRIYTFDIQPQKKDDVGVLTLDQLQNRILERAENVRKSLGKFQKQTYNVIVSSQVIKVMQKSLFGPQSPNLSPGIMNLKKSMQASPPLGSKQFESNDFESINSQDRHDEHQPGIEYDSIAQEPAAALVKSNASKSTTPNRKEYLNVDRGSVFNHIMMLKNREPMIAQSQAVSMLSMRDEIKLNNQEDYDHRQSFLEQSFNDIMKYTRKIRMSGVYMLTRLLCRKICYRDERIVLLDRAIKMLKQDTDIVSVLEKLQDIDKLKKLILNNDQLFVFNYTPKPVVRARRNEATNLVKFQSEDDPDSITKKQKNTNKRMSTDRLLRSKVKFKTLQSFFRLYRAYDNLYHQNNKETITKSEIQVNNKLMYLIGDDLRNVFEVSYFLEDTTNLIRQQTHNPLKNMSSTVKLYSKKIVREHFNKRRKTTRIQNI